jgi:hypothetical protein
MSESSPQPGFAPGQLFSGPHPQSGARRPHVLPGVAHVYVTADGEYIVNSRRPSIGQAIAAKNRYDVDMRDKTSALAGDDLPTRENAFYFPYQISLAWHVHDPIEVLQRGISDADTVIRQSLLSEMRDITMQIDPADWRTAERSLNGYFAAPRPLAGGITVIRFSAQLKLDPGMAEHERSVASVQGQLRIDELNRRAVEQALQKGDMGILVEYLTKNTDSTRDVLQLVLENHRTSEKDRQELRRLMLEKVDKGTFQDVDVQWLLSPFLPSGAGSAATGQLFAPPTAALTAGTRPGPPAVTSNATIGMSAQTPPPPVQQPAPAGSSSFTAPAAQSAPPPAQAAQPAPKTAQPARQAPAVGGVIEWVDVEGGSGS